MRPSGSPPWTSGRTFGERRRRWARTSGRTSSQIGTRPRYSAQRLRGSTTAPPPGAITRRIPGSASAGPSASHRLALQPAEGRLAVLREDLGDPATRRPPRSARRGPRTPPRGGCARRRPMAVLPDPGSPTRTTSTAGPQASSDASAARSACAAGAAWPPRARRCRRPAPGPRASRRCAPGSGAGCRGPRPSSRRRSSRGRTAASVSITIASAMTPAAGTTRDVAALVVGLVHGLAGHEVRRRQRPGERGDGLHRAAHDDRLAVGHAARQAARVVAAVDPGPVLAPARRSRRGPASRTGGSARSPSPSSTPLTMLMLITAGASAASRRRSQWT